MEKLSAPNIICHLEKSENMTLYDCQWIPMSSKFVTMGGLPNGTGTVTVYDIDDKELKPVSQIKRKSVFKCGTFGASSFHEGYLATGNLNGQLQIWDLQDIRKPVHSIHAHEGIIHTIDGIGGTGNGSPELATGGEDGAVKIWDTRVKNHPVIHITTESEKEKRDCWAVTFGNSYNSTERMVCAGYDNGDIKLFDLRNQKIKWSTCIKNGVCSLEFDRKDIPINKLVATSLESHFYVYDVRTQHPKSGFSHIKETAHKSTIWAVRHLPQNRDLFMTCGGSGSICLWEYRYPTSRVTKDINGETKGVCGSLRLLQNCILSTQPVSSFSWCNDKEGLAVCTSFDQTVRVILVTGLKRV